MVGSRDPVAGMRMFIHGCAATPLALLDALALHGKNAHLHNIEVIHIHTEGDAAYSKPEYEGQSPSQSQSTKVSHLLEARVRRSVTFSKPEYESHWQVVSIINLTFIIVWSSFYSSVKPASLVYRSIIS